MPTAPEIRGENSIMHRMQPLAAPLLAATLLFAAAAPTRAATTYDLKANWSDTANPNGPWSFNQGATALPADADWTPISTTIPEYNPKKRHIAQPAWAPGNTTGMFLPGFFKSKITIKASKPPFDWKKGDIVFHTTDQFNGQGSGPANIVWTSPSGGRATISGVLWNARDINRNQDWRLLVNGAAMASGSLPGDGTITRANPTKFKLKPVAIAAGASVELLVVENSSSNAGDLVGAEIKIKLGP
jgi:hypothetical protein